MSRKNSNHGALKYKRSKNCDRRPNRRQKITDEENRTARKSHCEPVERQQCDTSRALVSSLSRHSRSDTLECTPVMNSFGGRTAGCAMPLAQIVRDDLA